MNILWMRTMCLAFTGMLGLLSSCTVHQPQTAEQQQGNVHSPQYDMTFVDNGNIHLMASNSSKSLTLFSGESPYFSPDGKRLLYTDDQDILWVYDLIKKTGHKLLHAPEAKPTWSPDMKYFVYTTGENEKQQINIFDLAEEKNIIIDQGSTPVWVPDGTALVYTRNDDIVKYSFVTNRSEIFLRNAKSIQFSPDGKRIVFVQDKYVTPQRGGVVLVPLNQLGKQIGVSSVWLASADGSAKRTLLKVPIHAGKHDKTFDMLRWSPDGTKILIVKTRTETENLPGLPPSSSQYDTLVSDLSVYNFYDSTEKTLITNIKWVSRAFWTQGNSKIAYTMFEDPPPVVIEDQGKQGILVLHPKGLHPDMFDRYGIDKKYLDNDKIFIIDIQTKQQKYIHSGHALDARN